MTGTDTELLELCAAWCPANARYMSVVDRLGNVHEDDQSAAAQALANQVHRAVHHIEERIFDTPAVTLAGLKAKAEILAFMGTEMGIPIDGPQGWSLVTNILAIGADW